MPQQTPLGAIARGLVAGAVGTGVMTLAQTLPAKLQSPDGGGQQSEEQQPQDPWEQASMPAKVARHVSRGLFGRDLPAERIPLLTNAMHWAYGTGWGAVYGIVQGTAHGRTVRSGLLFGTGVWAMSYVQLVPMGLQGPPWSYPAKGMAQEIGYHLAYGLGVAGGYRLLDR